MPSPAMTGEGSGMMTSCCHGVMLAVMRRTQIQFDEETYAAVRKRAYEEKRSISSVVRDVVAETLGVKRSTKRPGLEQFAFVGAGRSRQGKLSPVSERHDEALADALWKEHRG